MAKRSPREKSASESPTPRWERWIPFILAALTFAVYWPSLQAEFVYDARIEILSEGFIANWANLTDVLSLKVLSMPLMLGDRPGQLLYLMLNAAVWGKEPWGYHLGNNLLHAANVALLYLLLRRLSFTHGEISHGGNSLKVSGALVVASLIFALHPLAVEPVSAINYSSDLLVALFTFLALLPATYFRADGSRKDWLMGSAGAFCAFASVTCKESGIATPLLLIAYWFLFRRGDAFKPWLLFLSGGLVLSGAFLTARFHFAPPSDIEMPWLGGSFAQVFLIQPRLWVFMLGKIVWPVSLSADYTLENTNVISLPLATAALLIVLVFQSWLSSRSRLGALGVAMFWLGLATVSNFIPLYRILADRFYYLPMVGMAMQLAAVLLLLLKSRAYWAVVTPFAVALVPLTWLTLVREDIFANDISLWSDTIEVSPHSWIAHYNLGTDFSDARLSDKAMVEFQKAVELNPQASQAYNDMGTLLLQEGRTDEAVAQFEQAIKINPKLTEAQSDLGLALIQQGKLDEAIVHFQSALALKPDFAEVHFNLGNALSKKGNLDQAVMEYEKAIALKPAYVEAHTNLGIVLSQQGRLDEAVSQFQEVVRLKPNDQAALHNLDVEQAVVQKAHTPK